MQKMFANQKSAKFMKLIHAKKLNADPLQNTTEFLLFLDQNVFSMLQNIVTNPLMSHDYFDGVFISFLDKDSIPYTHFQWRDRKLSD